MRFREPVRMADDAGEGPVWARTSGRRRRGGGGAIFGLPVFLLAVFGALMIGLGVKERSVAEAGAMVDGWVSTGWSKARGLVGMGEAAATEVVEAAPADAPAEAPADGDAQPAAE